MLQGDGGFECDDVGVVDSIAAVWWTPDMVQDALVEAHDLWRRSPRAGHRALKSSWPNEMVQRIEGGDHDARGGDMVAPVPAPLPLSRDEVARRDAVSAWLEYIPAELNRRIVVLALEQLARGRSQVSWRRVQRQLRIERGRGALPRRFDRAIGVIVAALNYPEGVALARSGSGARVVADALGLSFAEAHALVRRLQG